MNEPYERELAVFSAARRLPAAERTAYLDQTCAGDAALRRRVEELLRASENAEGFLQEPAPGAQRLCRRPRRGRGGGTVSEASLLACAWTKRRMNGLNRQTCRAEQARSRMGQAALLRRH